MSFFLALQKKTARHNKYILQSNVNGLSISVILAATSFAHLWYHSKGFPPLLQSY
jgi:hypothetical protein